MAKQGSPAIPQLRALLTDPILDVRLEAVKSIVEIGTQQSLDPLVQATRDADAEVQIRAIEGLVNFYLPGYVKTGFTASFKKVGSAFKGKFTDTNDAVIASYIQVRADVIEALGKLVRGGVNQDVRANAARAIGILRGRAAVPDLIEALRSKQDQTLYESLIALQKIKDPESAKRITFLLHDPDEKVQVAALETAGLLGNHEALPELRDTLDRTRSNRVRRATLTAIAMLPEEANRQLYARYLQDKDDGLRGAAAEGYGRLQNKSDLALIEKTFNDERKPSPRLSQAFALVMLGKTELSEMSPLQYLVNTLNSSAHRGEARALLIEVARLKNVRTPLEKFLPSGTRDEKIQLVQILSYSGDKDTLSAIEGQSEDKDAEVGKEALRGVRTLKSRLP
jgi:HEAT repeat protein